MERTVKDFAGENLDGVIGTNDYPACLYPSDLPGQVQERLRAISRHLIEGLDLRHSTFNQRQVGRLESLAKTDSTRKLPDQRPVRHYPGDVTEGPLPARTSRRRRSIFPST